MFRWVHLIEALASLVRNVCESICSVFGCPEHSERKDK